MALTFDGVAKVVTLSSGTVALSVRDLYSRWKDWVLAADNSKWPHAFETVGGDVIDGGAGTRIPLYAFLADGWRIKPQEANHTLVVNDGILLVDGGGDPFIATTGSFVVRVNYQQPVQAISFDAGGGTGPSAAAIAAEVLAQMNLAPPGVDIKKVNGTSIAGAGIAGVDPWRPA